MTNSGFVRLLHEPQGRRLPKRLKSSSLGIEIRI